MQNAFDKRIDNFKIKQFQTNVNIVIETNINVVIE